VPRILLSMPVRKQLPSLLLSAWELVSGLLKARNTQKAVRLLRCSCFICNRPDQITVAWLLRALCGIG